MSASSVAERRAPPYAGTDSRRVSLVRRWTARLLMIGALVLAAQALWIPAKAALAQVLLERAWSKANSKGAAPPPWPWADTRPVARLTREQDGHSQIVLEGDSGRVLAFGPGWNPSSAAPGTAGTPVISAHRDTHFAWLRGIADGEIVRLEATGGSRRYRLASRQIVDVRAQSLLLDDPREGLLLVTCWPFDAAEAGGTQRLLLHFEAVPAEAIVNQRAATGSSGAG
jgi:sortase A